MSAQRWTAVGGAHPRVREYLQAKRRGREQAAVEGLWALERALAAAARIEAVFVCPELVRGPATARAVEAAEAAGAEVLQVGRRLLDRLVDRDGPDGLAALVALPRWRLDDLGTARASTLVLVVDRVEKPGNLGTLVRCADGAGATAVLLTEAQVRPTHPQAVRASMGTIFSMPLVSTSTDDALGWARRQRIRLVAADPRAAVPYRSADYRGPVAVVVGSERQGLTERWRDAVDEAVSIPMLGTADSLNVGHAAALLLYEAVAVREGGRRASSAPPGGSSR